MIAIIIESKINNHYCKSIISFIFLIIFIYLIYIQKLENNNNKNILSNLKPQMNKIIEENFFIIDSNDLEKTQSHMYGFSITKKGILTNNYYQNLGHYEEPEPQGMYIMIRKIGDEIKINQDYNGSFGIYIYENKITGYFLISNSFLLLEEYLVGKTKFTINKDFADNLIISGLCTPSIYETLIKEIRMLPSNSFIIINIKKRAFKTYYIDYNENSVPLESEEGLKIIDKWVDKWGYIIRSLKKCTNNISSHLSGGFDSRAVLSILLNSGIDINDILIISFYAEKKRYKEDFFIAKNISSKFGFKLNGFLNNNSSRTRLSPEDSFFCSIYSKLGFHSAFSTPTYFLNNPKFTFCGFGGEIIRGYPGYPINKYIDQISRGYKQFYNSSIRLCNRSIALLKKKNHILMIMNYPLTYICMEEQEIIMVRHL